MILNCRYLAYHIIVSDMSVISLKPRYFGLHFCRRYVFTYICNRFFATNTCAPKVTEFGVITQNKTIMLLKVIQGHWF